MSKKLISAFVALGVMAMSVFSIANAFALTVDAGLVKGKPLTSPLELCEEATANLLNRIGEVYERGLSLHMSKQEMEYKVYILKEYWRQVCTEAGVNYNKLKLPKGYF